MYRNAWANLHILGQPLTYLTSFSPEGVEGLYRNSMDDVVRFLVQRHAGCHKVRPRP
jgi:hypothetical protein